MHLIRTRLATRLASLAATVLLAASTASAMQTTPPAKPIAPERMAQLVETRRQIIDFRNQGKTLEDPAGREAREAAFKLETELSKQPESEDALEQVQLDARALVMTITGEPGSRSVIPNLVSSLTSALRLRGSSVVVGFDELLGTLFLSGPRWQVEEAKVLAGDLNAALAQRVKEIRAAQLEQLREDRSEQERDMQAHRQAAQEELRAKTVSLAWNGGKLGDLIAAVQEQVTCNVVLGDPTVADVSIPALSVRLMSPEVFFQMLAQLPSRPGSEISVFVVNPASIDPTPTGPSKGDGSMSAITITRPGSMSTVEHEVFDVREWSKADSTSRLVDSIAFAMDAAGFTDRVKVRLHAPSNMLFVQGPNEAVTLIRKVLAATKAK